jgi:putative LysE/RhtB family amino acid efflux pump
VVLSGLANGCPELRPSGARLEQSVLTAFLLGAGLGAFVAAQVGPVSLLLIRSSLRYGAPVGLAIGAGAALVDTLYASLGVAGVAPLLTVSWLQLALGLVGGGVLVVIGLRTLWAAWRVRLGGEGADEVSSPRRAFLTAVAATASNPLTIISWAAIFAAASTAGASRTPTGALALLLGVALGSASWFAVLTAAVALARQRVHGAWLVAVDVVSGLGLVACGGVLGVRTAHDV